MFFEMPPCVHEAAEYYQVPVTLLAAIRHAEGGSVGQQVCGNNNGSCDVGPMQINTNWFNGRFGVNFTEHGITLDDATHDHCMNLYLGAWVLRYSYNHLGDWGEATMAYNAGLANRHIAKEYAARVARWEDRIMKNPDRVFMEGKPVEIPNDPHNFASWGCAASAACLEKIH